MSDKQEKARRQASRLLDWGEDWAKKVPDEWMKPNVWRRIQKYCTEIKEENERAHLSSS